MSSLPLVRTLLLAAALLLSNGLHAAPPTWKEYVASHTSGMVSKESEIRIRFVRDVVGRERLGKPADDLLRFDPPLTGSARFTNPRELVFTPGRPLPAGRGITVRLDTATLQGFPGELRQLEFRVEVIQQAFDVELDGLQLPAGNDPKFTLRGTLVTADKEEADTVEKLLTATYLNQRAEISWEHETNRRRHLFEVRDLARQSAAAQLTLAWNGAPLGIATQGSRNIEVPAQNSFESVGARIANDGKAAVIVKFSDALDPNQSLKGLVTLGEGEPGTQVSGNSLTVYPRTPIRGDGRLTIARAVRSARGVQLAKPVDELLHFEDPKPQVRFAGQGVILPDGPALSVPFEAMNVHSVQVTAFRIFDEHVGQFLQVNKLDGQRELGRVGRYLWRKTIALKEPVPNHWNRYAVDLGDLLRDPPGGLYRITLSIGRGNSLYACPASDAEKPLPAEPPPASDEDLNYRDASGWDGIESWYDEDYAASGEVQWTDRQNPCKDAYYTYSPGARAARNFIASNLGLLAKREPEGELRLVATDLPSAKPLADVELEVRNFQDRAIATARTDADGFARVKPDGTPFYLLARHGKDLGYLKLNPGSALPVSHFDVGGDEAKKGLKGYLYGERGVWRPGDPIYLTFVLQDRDHTLPDNHPATVQLVSPKGQVVQSVTNATPVHGFYAFTLHTADDAQTGNWTARLKLGGMTFTKELKIETVKPNRLKVELDLGGETLRRSLPVKARLFGQWLHGASAENLKADVNAWLTQKPTQFTRYADYVFDDPTRRFSGEKAQLWQGNLDADGVAQFEAQLAPAADPPGMLEANLTARIFENGGDSSVNRISVPYHPYDLYVGLKLPKGDLARDMLQTDKRHTLEIATLDPDGKPRSAQRIEVSLYKATWRWWWDQSGQGNAQYEAVNEHQLLDKAIVATGNDGRGTWEFEVKYPSWGRYLLRACDLDGRHCAARFVYIDWPGWAGRAQEQNSLGATMLSLAADKSSYNAGETAVLQLPETSGGRALVTVETGNRILAARWVELAPGKGRIEVPLTAAMSPTAYASVTLLQPHDGKKNDLPIRLYGILPLAVNDPATHLKPVIAASDEWKPQSTASFDVSEAGGRPMTYTVAVVDEGLLGLTNFKAADPHSHFYRKEALGIATWDLFDQVVGAYGAQLERLLSIGGSGVNDDPEDARRRKRFPPVVKFLGPFFLEAGKSAHHEFELPRYMGAVRVMVVAGEQGAYGVAEKSVYVRDAVIMLSTVPRVLGPGEQLRVPLSLFATDAGVRDVQVSVEADDHFERKGPSTITVHFDKPGEKMGFFDLAVRDALGIGHLRFTAVSGSHQAVSEVNVPIRMPNPVTVRETRAAIAPRAVMDTEVKPHGLAGTNKVSLEISAVPPLNLRNRLGWLIRYPHGCVEQTTSAVFPQLYLPALANLDAARKSEVEKNVNAAIGRLRQFQAGSGGFSYWPGDGSINDWASSYVGHFLTEAKRLGYYVPGDLYGAWLNHQQNLARAFTAGRDSQEAEQAYRLFTLALAGKPEQGAMNRLRESTTLPAIARWQLAAAFKLAGQDDAADALVRNQHFTPGSYATAGNTFGSKLRDLAIGLDALDLLGYQDAAGPLAVQISEALNADSFENTHAIAYSLYALSRYVLGEKGTAFSFAYAVGTDALKSVEATTPIATVELPDFPAQGAPLHIRNDAGKQLYAAAVVEGLPPPGEESGSADGVAVSVLYTDLAGNPLDVSRLPQGKDFMARVTVDNRSPFDLKNLALTEVVPSGWEIHNPRFEAGGAPPPALDYQDIRDDRLLSYFGLKRSESKSFSVLLNSAYLGRFYLPGLKVEAMYEGGIRANGKGQWVEVLSAEQLKAPAVPAQPPAPSSEPPKPTQGAKP